MTASMIREVSYSSVRMGGYEPIRTTLDSLFTSNTTPTISTSYSSRTIAPLYVVNSSSRQSESNNPLVNDKQKTKPSNPLIKFLSGHTSSAII